jgi:phage terminase large subunit
MLPVHWVFDLGWGDCTSVGGFQRHAGEVRLIEYIEASRRPLDWYAEQIGAKGWRVGSIILPKDSEQANMASGGRSTKDNAEAIWGAKSVKLLKSQNLEEGIRMVRGMFPRLYMRKGNGDANATTGMQRIIECASRYRRAINRITKQPEGPLHDEFSHGADMLRYAAAGEHLMQNSMETIETVEVIQSPTNWMAR